MAVATVRVPRPARAGNRPKAALAVLCLAVLIVNLDNTILNVALPTLVVRLKATTGQLQWIVDAYAMVFGGLMLVGGSLADRYGRRQLFLVGLVIFGFGSLGASLASGVDPLIGWRAVMGAGAALTIPSGLAIVNELFHQPAQRGKAVGIWSATIGLGIAIGPVAGGLLLSRFWWGSIFLVNIPVVVAGIIGGLLLVPDSRNKFSRRPDPLGGLLTVAGLGLILWAIIEGPNDGWLSPTVLGAALAGLVVMGGFVAWEHHIDHPMLPLAFFRSRRFSLAIIAVALGVFALLGGLFVQTQFLQFGRGYSPLEAGLCILPVAGLLATGALTSPWIVRAIGTKFTAATGLLLVSGGLLQVAIIVSVTTTYAEVLPGMLLMGLGAGLLMPSATDSVLGTLTRDDTGVGSATNSTAMQVGGAMGVAVIGSVLSTRYQHTLEPALAGHHVPPVAAHTILGSLGGALAVARIVGGSLGAGLAHVARVGFALGSHSAFLVAAAVTGTGALLILAALPSRPLPEESVRRLEPGSGEPPAPQSQQSIISETEDQAVTPMDCRRQPGHPATPRPAIPTGATVIGRGPSRPRNG
jgi:EmrB/QacA subfamily drug resistance transporter